AVQRAICLLDLLGEALDFQVEIAGASLPRLQRLVRSLKVLPNHADLFIVSKQNRNLVESSAMLRDGEVERLESVEKCGLAGLYSRHNHSTFAQFEAIQHNIIILDGSGFIMEGRRHYTTYEGRGKPLA